MQSPDLPRALQGAVDRLRARLGEPTAALALLVPASTNGVLARQALQRGGSFIRVRALTPDQLQHGLARLPLARAGRRPAPLGWLELTLARRLPHLGLPGDLGDTLTRPGWIPALAATLTRLERAGVVAEDLDGLPASRHRDVLRAALHEVAAQRADHGYAGPIEVLQAARQGLSEGEALPPNRLRGAIVLGDRALSPDTHALLSEWLAPRPVELVLPAPLDALPAAPLGLRSAAGNADTTVVLPATPTALATVRGRLWREPDGRVAPDDPTVTLARTPDEQREIQEACRIIRSALRTGTPLDRIALVVPDASQAEVVRETLRRASLPATLLVGPPLTSGPSGSFLRLALDVAAGQDDLSTWHALLTTPALRLSRALGEGATAGRGRWRRLLAGCGATRRVTRIRQGLAELRDGLQASDARDPEGDRVALDALDAALGALATDLADLRVPRSLGAFARACAAFLHRWGARSQESVQLQAFLKSHGTGGQAVPFALARQELIRLLDATPQLEGTLSDRALVVATPMALLGGDFDLVCITGMAHGRLPRRLHEDALLPDALIDALRASGHDLLPSTVLAQRDPRRLAAAISAAGSALWLSAPAYEMLEGRPTLPSALLLDIATALAGERVGFGALEHRFVRSGSRHRAFAVQPDRALSAAEHRTARAWNQPLASLPWLLTHPAALRVVLQLLRGEEDGPSPWTGAVPTDLVEIPGLQAPARARSLQRLLADPEAFFLKHILGAWPARSLPGPVDVLGDVNPWVSAALDRAIPEGQTDEAGLLDAWEGAVREAMPLDELDEDALRLGRELARRTLRPILEGGVDLRESAELEDAPLGGWRISGRQGFDGDDGLHVFLWGNPPSSRKALEERAGLFLQALAEGRSDGEVVRMRSLKGKEVSVPLGEVRQEALAWLHAASLVVETGWWPDRPVLEALQQLGPPATARTEDEGVTP